MQNRLGLVETNLSGQITRMIMTRHFIDIGSGAGARRVHYRRCGSGPALLMVHQSPRSSAEYDALMSAWAEHFTCIAPDTPGFGQSDPLLAKGGQSPEIDDFADALVALLDALGLTQVAAYGFHSGAIILVNALKRHPQRFRRLAIGGYAIWTDDEMRIFGDAYLPPFVPSAYGEHLPWLWNRILEQSWFFPWFDVRDVARLSVAHHDPARVHAVVMDMLDAGDTYRAGYGAVLRAPRDIPPLDTLTPPVLITAYDGDPLQSHIDRLGEMPTGWVARKVATPGEHYAQSLAFLLSDVGAPAPALPETRDAGFVPVTTDRFSGLIHWNGDIDPPGHGLSDDWDGQAPHDWASWQAVFDAYQDATGRAVSLPPLPKGDPNRLYPDLSPDRFGSYLTKAWGIVRASTLYEPWYDVGPATARHVDPAQIAPQALARQHRGLLRAKAAKALHIARLSKGDN
jgi:haloalkane dehalogenase